MKPVALARSFRGSLSRFWNQAKPSSGSYRVSTFGSDPVTRYKLGKGMEMFPPALRAMTLMGNLLASIPKTVVTSGRFPEEVDGARLNNLLENPHPLIPGSVFWGWMGERVFSTGNSYAYIERAMDGRPIRLHPADVAAINPVLDFSSVPSVVTADYNLSLLPLGNWNGDGNVSTSTTIYGLPPGPFGPSDVLHLRGPGFRPYSLQSRDPIKNTGLKTTFFLWQAINIYLQRIMEFGSHGIIVIELPAGYDDEKGTEALKRVGASLASMNAGVTRAGNPLVLKPGEVAKSFTAQLNDELVRLKERLTIEIAQATGVPPFLMYAYQGNNATWQRPQLAEQWSQFCRSTLSGWLKAHSEECSKKLMSRDAYPRQRVRFDARRLELGSFMDTIKAAGEAVQKNGLFTGNEARALVDYAPMEGQDDIRQVTGAPKDDEERDGEPAAEPENGEVDLSALAREMDAAATVQ